ncbi:vitamin D-binding protein-like isoform X2 [Ascaphus truei]|uniref:vitamin D-binding protein-like isoform X2 n=1 Tax=Ascaphus truei TaxID=8439 RepID=UPI003F599FFF
MEQCMLKMQKLCYAIFLIILLVHTGQPKSFSEKSGFPRSVAKKNTGCELTYNMGAVFHNNALIFYSQILVNNSLEDVKRLVNNLMAFISNCCMNEAGAECFEDKNNIFLDRACEDNLSQFKNQEVTACCSQRSAAREACFKSVQHGTPVNMTEIDNFTPFWSECLSYVGDHRTFVETHLYDFSRQYRIFPPRTMAKIIIASLKKYDKCCKDYFRYSCLKELLPQIKNTTEAVIAEGNKICLEYIKIGKGKILLWYTYEYTRRHRRQTLDVMLNSVSEFEMAIKLCCQEVTNSTCLSTILTPFGFSFHNTI